MLLQSLNVLPNPRKEGRYFYVESGILLGCTAFRIGVCSHSL